MSVEHLIPKKIEEYFQRELFSPELKLLNFFIFRHDGIVLYCNSQKFDKSSVGALMGGIWQAAKALSDFLPKSHSSEEFRLSFDSSSEGLYILPLKIIEGEYYLGMIYHDQLNPGQVKNRVRDLSFRLCQFLGEEMRVVQKDQEKDKKKGMGNKKGMGDRQPPKRTDFLFDSISDDEIDSIFFNIGQ